MTHIQNNLKGLQDATLDGVFTYRTEHNGYYGGSLEYAGLHDALPVGATQLTKDGMPS